MHVKKEEICFVVTAAHQAFIYNAMIPPLTEEDIPSGQWLCHNCCMTKAAPSSSKSSSVERTSSASAVVNSRPNTPSAGGDLESIPLKFVICANEVAVGVNLQ
ncbi:hypothetical protein EVAR_71947_1 [Eumeta japonica]|uniref:Uncharacterized protein n=1 Tax=Eumeta variegata TaxID=151549 RepID=A0A4C1TLX2_EUMVA|nr:hypothetical protein EVAR_71947_1 [Eumeta japonica]